MLHIRPASAGESFLLSEIAFRSEAYWGYDTDYMQKFRSEYQVTEEFIRNNPTFVIEENKCILGFYGLLLNHDERELEYFFIEPVNIGKGLGKKLWDHVVHTCRHLQIPQFTMVTSPQASSFYIKQGAVLIGEVESLLKKGRMIPRLSFKVEPHSDMDKT